MSTLFERIENAARNVENLVFIGIGIVLLLIFHFFIFDNNFVLSFLVAGGITTIAYMVYSDIQKRKLQQERMRKEEDIMKEKKLHQQEKEQKMGRCISCTQELKPSAEKCPNCGYKIHKYAIK